MDYLELEALLDEDKEQFVEWLRGKQKNGHYCWVTPYRVVRELKGTWTEHAAIRLLPLLIQDGLVEVRSSFVGSKLRLEVRAK